MIEGGNGGRFEMVRPGRSLHPTALPCCKLTPLYIRH